MRTEKEFKEERFFGLQKFKTFEKAFNVMAGQWGEAVDGQPEIVIATEKLFKKAILARAIEKYIDYKVGKISLEACNRDLGLGKDTTDYLLDFDFILHAKTLNSFYTSRMGMKDDGVTKWNDRQWKYFAEIYSAYSFGAIVSKAKGLVESYCKKWGPLGEDEAGGAYADIINDQGLILV